MIDDFETLLTLFTRHNLESCGNIDCLTCLNFVRQRTEMHTHCKKQRQTNLAYPLPQSQDHPPQYQVFDKPIAPSVQSESTTGLIFDSLNDDTFIDQLVEYAKNQFQLSQCPDRCQAFPKEFLGVYRTRRFPVL